MNTAVLSVTALDASPPPAPTGAVFLIRQGTPWRVTRLDRARAAEVTITLVPEEEANATEGIELGPAIVRGLYSLGHAGQDVLLTVGADACLVGRFETAHLPRQPSPELLLFELERLLPVAAEEVVADFVLGDGTAWGAAVVAQDLEPVVQACEWAGVGLAAIVPETLLILSGLRSQLGCAPNEWVILAWDGRWEAIRLRDGRVADWATARTLEGLTTPLRMWQTVDPTGCRVVTCGVDAGMCDAIAQSIGQTVESLGDPAESLLRSAIGVLDGSLEPAINFRRGRWADPEPLLRIGPVLTTACWSMVATLLVLAGACEWRAVELRGAAEARFDQQAALYRGLFPEQSIPSGILSRLEGEARQARAVRSGAGQAAQPSSAGVTLQQFLAAIPAELRLRITSIDIEEDRVVAEVELPTLTDGTTLAQGLSERGFEVSPGRTEQSPGGQGFRTTVDARRAALKEVPISIETPLVEETP